MADERLKVDRIRFPRLEEDELEINVNSKGHVYLIHSPTKIAIDADTKPTLQENWILAQQALDGALEHREAAATPGPETV